MTWLWCIVVMTALQHAGGFTPADVEAGARLYGAHCSACHGADGDMISGVDLRRGRFRRGSSDEDLMRVIAGGIQGTAMPPNKFTAAELTGVVAYIRSMRDFHTRRVALGDGARGRLLFEGKGACRGCHRVNGKGSHLATDLSEIGAIRSGEALERTLLDPNAAALPQNRWVRAVTRQGTTITGRRLNEDTFTVQIIDDRERLVSLSKPDLQEYTIVKTSPMPSYRDQLSAQQRADLIAYLLSLRGAY